MERKNGKTIGSKFTIMFSKCRFGKNDFCQLILLFNLFLLLLMGLTALFDAIHESYSKISESQTDPKCVFGSSSKN